MQLHVVAHEHTAGIERHVLHESPRRTKDPGREHYRYLPIAPRILRRATDFAFADNGVITPRIVRLPLASMSTCTAFTTPSSSSIVPLNCL